VFVVCIKKHLTFFLSIFLVLSLSPTIGWSQEGEDDFFDDEEGDSGFEEETNMPEPPPVDGGRPSPRNRFNSDNSPGFRPPAPSASTSRAPIPEGSIEFRLVEPPKYWTPKKRKLKPPVTSNNEAK
jgi:hypothetical protein